MAMVTHAGGADETLSVVLLFAGLWVGWAGWSRLRGRSFPRLPAAGSVAFVVAGVALVASAAVVPGALFPPTSPAQPTAASGPRPSSTATLSFARPAANAQVRGDELDVVFTLDGGRVVDAATTELTADTGHIHLTLDGRLVSMTYGLVQAVDLRGLSPGTHVLEAEFVAADHAPFDPRVTVSLTFGMGGP